MQAPSQESQDAALAQLYPSHHPMHPLNRGSSAPPPAAAPAPDAAGGGRAGGVAAGKGGAGGGALPAETVAFVLRNAALCCCAVGDWSSWRLLQGYFRGSIAAGEAAGEHEAGTGSTGVQGMEGLQALFESQAAEAEACVDAGNWKVCLEMPVCTPVCVCVFA